MKIEIDLTCVYRAKKYSSCCCSYQWFEIKMRGSILLWVDLLAHLCSLYYLRIPGNCHNGFLVDIDFYCTDLSRDIHVVGIREQSLYVSQCHPRK